VRLTSWKDDGLIGPASGAISDAGHILRISAAGRPQRTTSASRWSICSVYKDQEEGRPRCRTCTTEKDKQGQPSPAAGSTAAGDSTHTIEIATASLKQTPESAGVEITASYVPVWLLREAMRVASRIGIMSL
jgi:hypothetical protein